MATRKDVAELAGVSPAVVSYVINNSNYVNDKTRKRVLEAISELKYHPNLIASNLRKSKSKLIVLIGNSLKNQFFSEIAYHMEDAARNNGYLLTLCGSVKDSNLVHTFLSYQVAGICIASDIFNEEELNGFAQRKTPLVLYKNREYVNALDPYISLLEFDYKAAFLQMTEYLLNKGHSRIAFLSVPELNLGNPLNYRLQGFLKAVKAKGLSSENYLISHGLLNNSDSLSMTVDRILEKKVSAAVCSNDDLAIELVSQLNNRGIMVPGDISVTGAGNTDMSRLVSPPLTTISFGREAIAKASIELIIDKINNKKTIKKRFQGEIIARKSG